MMYTAREKELRKEKRRSRRDSLRKSRDGALALEDLDGVASNTREGVGGMGGEEEDEEDIMAQVEKMKAEHLKQIELDAAQAAAEDAFAQAATPHVNKSKRASLSTTYDGVDDSLIEGLEAPVRRSQEYEDKNDAEDDGEEAASVDFGSDMGSEDETVQPNALPHGDKDGSAAGGGGKGVFGVGFFGL